VRLFCNHAASVSGRAASVSGFAASVNGFAAFLGRGIACLACCGGLAAILFMPPRLNASGRDEADAREASGDLAGARALLEQRIPDGGASAEQAMAEFLDRHLAADRRDAYAKWASIEPDSSKRLIALRELLLIDFEDGHGDRLNQDLKNYTAAGGTDLHLAKHPMSSGAVFGVTQIPGPLHSFARMAALSPGLAPEDLLPSLARNVVTNGYQASSSNEALDQTEYLRLLIRYVGQARELTTLAGSGQKIVIPTCDSGQTADLLKILGYRMRGSCGGDVVLETVNPSRAFLTVDSGFPISRLEQDLRANRKFEYDYAPTKIPVLYGPEYWTGNSSVHANRIDFIDTFLNDPALCRLYLGLTKLDNSTAESLRRKISPGELKLYAPVLDFFGSMFQIQNGVAFAPGPEKTWAELAGASPSQGAAFYQKVLETDDGWLASYFDALARLDSPAGNYLRQPERMKRFYYALRSKVTTPGPARPVFRSSTDLLLLTTSLRLDSNGQPHIPGGLDAWKPLFVKHPRNRRERKLSKEVAGWRSPDDLLEALFNMCRRSVENEPLRIFLALNDIDRDRNQPLSPAMAGQLIDSWRIAGSQYPIFAGAPTLSESSMNLFLDFVHSSVDIRDTLVRADAVGSAQALVGIWQILCRQNTIPASAQDASFSQLLTPYLKVHQSVEVFDAARAGVKTLLHAANGPANETAQNAMMDLLVGPPQVNPLHPGPAENLLRAFDAQQLLTLDGVFAAADALSQASPDKKALKAVDNQLSRFEEAESQRSSLSGAERNLLALGYWSERHIDQERKLDLDALARGNDRKDVRGKLTPFLRDTLVGLLYAYYSPDGAQLVFANPLFVRNHDFIGAQGLRMTWHPTELTGNGWPASGGGRMMGSLVSLPYAMAEAEQNFLSPTREQALIWGDLVPQLIVDVTVSHWRSVSQDQVRWVALHLRRGENLLAGSAFDPSLETKVMKSLARFANPARIDRVENRLHAGNFAAAQTEILPEEFYALANDPSLRGIAPDVASLEIAALKASNNPKLKPEAIASVFGTPKPTLTHSYRPGLLYLRTFPTLMGYSSRLLAETWESNGFYYAKLADELGIPANQMDAYVPEWTRATIENIFATHLEDWPALLRSLRFVGDNLRQHNGSQITASNSTDQSGN
jgi:hypothetical protein